MTQPKEPSPSSLSATKKVPGKRELAKTSPEWMMRLAEESSVWPSWGGEGWRVRSFFMVEGTADEGSGGGRRGGRGSAVIIDTPFQHREQ
jgi:hypothetical protein